jgi:hypothetical protein
MEIHNYPYGTKIISATPSPGNSYKNLFYGKNVARVSVMKQAGSDIVFEIKDVSLYQQHLQFKRASVTAIFNDGVAVPLPGTDELLYDLLCIYFYSSIPAVNNLIVPISGVNYNAVLADNGKTFLFDLPGTPKTFTIPSGLPIGWRCTVVKMYAASTLTVVGSGGMIVSGGDLVLNGQFSRMEILVTGVNSALAFNTGG